MARGQQAEAAKLDAAIAANLKELGYGSQASRWPSGSRYGAVPAMGMPQR